MYICEARTTGMFGDPDTNLCVEKCPSPYFGDPTGNRTCVIECPDGYFAQNTTAAGVASAVRICVQTCDYGWADNITRKCTKPGCKCIEFGSKFTCNCSYPFDEHMTIIESREETLKLCGVFEKSLVD